MNGIKFFPKNLEIEDKRVLLRLDLNVPLIDGKILETESCARISVEAGSIKGWAKYIKNKGDYVGLDSFGKSAPYKDIYKDFKLTTDDIVKLTREMIINNKK